MKVLNIVLRSLLINIKITNKIGPRPSIDSILTMREPRSNYSYAMEIVTTKNLAKKIGGQEITGYYDMCVLTPRGVKYLETLNKEFYKVYKPISY